MKGEEVPARDRPSPLFAYPAATPVRQPFQAPKTTPLLLFHDAPNGINHGVAAQARGASAL